MPQDKQDLPDHIAALFAASAGLYLASVAEIEAGRALPADADSPSAIAFNVAMVAIREGCVCPDWAAQRVAQDWARFETFRCRTLGEAFGVPARTQLRAKRAELLASFAFRRVGDYQRKGVPLKDNAKGLGALSLVGDELGMSGKQVERLMTRWRKLCRSCGKDPGQSLALGDAESVVRDAVSRGLRSIE